MIITSAFTPQYQLEEDEFLKSTEDNMGYGDTIDIRVWPCKGSWRLNCGQKPAHILDVLEQHKVPVLWVDIDGRFRKPFSLGGWLAQEFDFAAWFIPNKRMQKGHVPGGPDTGNDGIASGTMWFNYTPAALAWLRAWVDYEEGQGKYEQQIMGDLWYQLHGEGKAPLTYRLPQQYCKVFDVPWFRRSEDHTVIIEHMQASRRLKNKVGR